MREGRGEFARFVKQADALWSKIIKARAPHVPQDALSDYFVCQCGCGEWTKNVEAAHGIPRDRSTGGMHDGIRWSLDNGLALKRDHHARIEKNRQLTREAFVPHIGVERWELLEASQRFGCQVKADDVRKIIVGLKREAERMGIR